ncbi:MAG: FkbM family methyltransferase [Sulfitobacter sp.]
MVTKTVNFSGRTFEIEGVAADDPYFAGLADHSDADFARLIATMLPVDATALDIGANIGITSCMLGQHLTNGQVFSFEPSPSVYPILSRNIAANNLANVTTRQLAMGAKKGKLGFVGESAYGHLVSSDETESQKMGNTVSVETIDRIVKEKNLGQIDFIKIDVEGFEDQVLAGGSETEAKFAPLYYMEFNAFCIAAYRQLNPFDFAQQVLQRFEHVYLVAQDGSFERLAKDPAHLLHTNIVNEGSVSNLLMTNDPKRLEMREKVHLDELLDLKTQLAHVTNERNHARRYPWKYLRSALKRR